MGQLEDDGRVETFCLTVYFSLVLDDGVLIHAKSSTHRHKEFRHEMRAVVGEKRGLHAVVRRAVLKKDTIHCVDVHL